MPRAKMKTNTGLPYYYDPSTGKHVSALTGQEFDSLASLAATDQARYNLYAQLAGRDLDYRELQIGGTLDEVDEDDPMHGFSVTRPPAELTPAQRSRKATEYLRRQELERNETPRQRAIRTSEEETARLEALEAEQADKAEIAARPETKANLSKAREIQRQHQFFSGKRRTLLNECERCVEFAQSGQTVKFEKLHSELRQVLVDHLQESTQAKVDELSATINRTNEALAEVTSE